MISFIWDKVRRLDPILFVCTSILSIMSILVLFGARNSEFGSMRRVIMQIAMTFAGLVFMIIIANIDLSHHSSLFYIIVLGFSAAMLVLLLFVGDKVGMNNQNWIELPIINISVQPSEFIRATFILTFAKHLSEVKDSIHKIKTLIPLLLHAGLIIGLLLLTGDLGMVLVYCGIIAVMLFCAGLPLWYFLIAIVLIALAFPFLWDFLEIYQQERILIGFNPDLDPTNVGLQQIKSRTAISGGGFFGRGINGAGSYKRLSSCLTDFIFATYAEMFGFFGCFVLIGLMTTIVVRLIVLARRASDPFASLVCAGVIGMMLVQTVENIGMCLCLLPVVGITLPFLSAGGSSMLSIYMVFGLVHGTTLKKSKLL